MIYVVTSEPQNEKGQTLMVTGLARFTDKRKAEAERARMLAAQPDADPAWVHVREMDATTARRRFGF